MGRLFGAAVVLLGFALPASAQGYLAVNRLVVNPVAGGDFEVIEARGEGARGMWCAAADYVLAARGSGNRTRLYVKEARGPAATAPGRKGVTFTTNADRLAVQPSQAVSVSVRQTGQGLPVNHALQFCRDFEEEYDDIWVAPGSD